MKWFLLACCFVILSATAQAQDETQLCTGYQAVSACERQCLSLWGQEDRRCERMPSDTDVQAALRESCFLLALQWYDNCANLCYESFCGYEVI